MRARLPSWIAVGLLVGLGALTWVGEAGAQAKAGARAARPAKARPAQRKKAPDKPAQPEVAPAAPAREPLPAPGEPARSSGEGESDVKGAGSDAKVKAEAVPAPVSEKGSAEGVKTYRFGAIEVEGRLRSPQVIYFLRRVRAEFDAAALGHRSFLRELSDTRNDPAFR